MFMIDYKDLGWRYWFVAAVLLTAGVLGNPLAFPVVISVAVVQILHFAVREQNITAFSVQVRSAFLLVLLVAFAEPLRVLYWIPTIGLWTMLLFGYCTMARIISLLPWNRDEPFSLALVKNTFLSPPVQGSLIQHRLPAQPAEQHP